MDPLLLWGLFSRAFFVVLVIAFGSFINQVLPQAGSKGYSPVASSLAGHRKAFTTWKRFFYFPTLFWLNSSDAFIALLPKIGVAAALCGIYGGVFTFPAYLTCYLCFLTLDYALRLHFPWECLILEASVFGLFLPSTLPLTSSLAMTELPSPLVAWCFRWLLFRVLFGFGKLKFGESNSADHGYIKAFVINQPIPSFLGYYFSKAPLVVAKLSLVFMFVAEIPVPLLVFFCGWPRVVAAVFLISLMMGIQLSGNFGYFNLLTSVMCIPLFDLDSSFTQFSFSESWAQGPLTHCLLPLALASLQLGGGFLQFIFNNWVTMSWFDWPLVYNNHPGLNWLRQAVRLRLVHGYGVFPPHVLAPIRFSCVFEGSNDGGKTWKEYEYKYQVTNERSAPVYVAPHHPRLDHGVYYFGLGNNIEDFTSSMFVSVPQCFGTPGTHSMYRIAMRLMEPNSPVYTLFKNQPFPASAPPTLMRIQLYSFLPTTHAERVQTGKWWQRKLVTPFMLPSQYDASLFEKAVRGPEYLHWDLLAWRHRSDTYQAMMAPVYRLCEAMGPVSAADCDLTVPDLSELIGGTPDLSPKAVEQFWNFLSSIPPSKRLDWKSLPETNAALRQQYANEWQTFELVWLRLSQALSARIEPFFFDREGYTKFYMPPNHAKTFFHLSMLIHHIMCTGRGVFESVWRDPMLASSIPSPMSPASPSSAPGSQHEPALKPSDAFPPMSFESGLFLWMIFYYDTLHLQSRSLRVTRSLTPERMPTFEFLPGFFRCVDFLESQTQFNYMSHVRPEDIEQGGSYVPGEVATKDKTHTAVGFPERLPLMIPPGPGGFWEVHRL